MRQKRARAHTNTRSPANELHDADVLFFALFRACVCVCAVRCLFRASFGHTDTLALIRERNDGTNAAKHNEKMQTRLQQQQQQRRQWQWLQRETRKRKQQQRQRQQRTKLYEIVFKSLYTAYPYP